MMNRAISGRGSNGVDRRQEIIGKIEHSSWGKKMQLRKLDLIMATGMLVSQVSERGADGGYYTSYSPRIIAGTKDGSDQEGEYRVGGKTRLTGTIVACVEQCGWLNSAGQPRTCARGMTDWTDVCVEALSHGCVGVMGH